MDPDLIRLILVVLGVLLVAGIYLWDRYKRVARPLRMVRPMRGDAADHNVDEAPMERLEPRIDTQPETIPDMPLDDQPAPSVAPPAQTQRSRQLDPDPQDIGTWDATVDASDLQFAMDLNFDAHGDPDYLSADPNLQDEVERKLIVLHVVPVNGEFRGSAIEKACITAQLRLGEMAIFHRHDPSTGKVLFSVANLVEPGSFPVGDMDTFVTPGLTMFTQLPGARDGLEIFEKMLATGRQLASLLHGELQDERHNKLTGQMERHIADSVIEHRRRVNLARSRH